MAGGQLVMALHGGHQDSGYLIEAIKKHEITIIQVVPTMLRMLVEEEGLSECKTLRNVYSGGEILTEELTRKYKQQQEVGLINLYGPTEATIQTSFSRADEDVETGSVTIGKPIANMKLYVLDVLQKPVPIGVAGEIYVSGVGLGRGYMGRPDLTAERFLPDPLSQQEGARMYRTGDIGTYLKDGRIKYQGRADEQVKVRGHRIELGEIEEVVREQRGVREVAVVVRKDKQGNDRLVGYVVADEEMDKNEVIKAVRDKLPEYMVPADIVRLEKLPKTASGKLDKRGLPQFQEVRETRAYQGARNAIEEILVGIWKDVLGVNRISIYDNFFELGGHSLLATQAVSRVRKCFQVEIPLQSIFEWPTVAQLASGIEEQLKVAQGQRIPSITPAAHDGKAPLSFAQQRLWFLDQLKPNNSAYNVPAAVRLKGDLQIKVLEETLSEIVRRHEALRTTFTITEGEPTQQIHKAEPIKIPLADISFLSEEQREAEVYRIAKEEAQRGFDLREGPLMRVGLVRMREQEHVFVMTMHHIISDGWSIGVLVKEMARMYGGGVRGEEVKEEELKVQYGDYARWQREWLKGEELEKEILYWRKQLDQAPLVLELVTDRPRPAIQTSNGAREPLALTLSLTEQLKNLSQHEGVTLFMTLLAAFNLLLYRYTDKDDILVGTPIAGRNQVEIEKLIGFFTNMLVLRTDLSGDPSFRNLLKRVRTTCLEAYSHQNIPFEKLVEELQPERDLSRNPMFQTVFSLQNASSEILELPGLTLSSLKVEAGTSLFDLMLEMSDGDQGLKGVFEYNTDLFGVNTIRQMIDHFITLLESIVADPDQQVIDIPLVRQEPKDFSAQVSRMKSNDETEQFSFGA
jgi:acyl carrier protein